MEVWWRVKGDNGDDSGERKRIVCYLLAKQQYMARKKLFSIKYWHFWEHTEFEMILGKEYMGEISICIALSQVFPAFGQHPDIWELIPVRRKAFREWTYFFFHFLFSTTLVAPSVDGVCGTYVESIQWRRHIWTRKLLKAFDSENESINNSRAIRLSNFISSFEQNYQFAVKESLNFRHRWEIHWFCCCVLIAFFSWPSAQVPQSIASFPSRLWRHDVHEFAGYTYPIGCHFLIRCHR